MEDRFIYYVSHYFEKVQMLKFFLLALGILFVFFVGLYLFTLASAQGKRFNRAMKREYIRIEWHVLVERFYEMIFSGTSILFFMAMYYLINRFVTMEPYVSIWEKYKDFFLLILISMSCIFNSFLDRVFVRFKFINREEKSAGRLSGMLYMILIFCYIKFIYEDNNYDMFITYLLGLMVGRFVYFDASVHDFIRCIKGVKKNLALLICVLTYTSIMCLYGFKTEYLLTHNGVITNVFFAHLFMCAAIFVLHHIHIAELVTGRGTRESKILSGRAKSSQSEWEYYEDDEEYGPEDGEYDGPEDGEYDGPEDGEYEYADYDEW